MQRRLNAQFQNAQMSSDQQTVLHNAIQAIDNVQQSQVQNISGTVI
jgi:tRNA threonylcarbamoyladenosine modification (KEOPS) complex Cgi121 subunit